MALRRMFRVTLALLPLSIGAACVSQPGKSPAADPAVTDVTAPQPRTATYSCADGGMMTIENLGASVRVRGPDGVSEDLPAAPANQNSRFGAERDAIVIDGGEALVMKGGHTPITCKR